MRIERARRLQFGAFRPAGLGGGRPGENVEMQPGWRVDEAAQEQRGGDGAAMAAGADIVEVGHLGIEHRLVRPPQRHAPHRIVLGGAVAHEFGGQRVVVGEERRHVGPERDARGAGQRGEIDDQLRLVLVGQRQRVGEDQPAFGVGIADLDA